MGDNDNTNPNPNPQNDGGNDDSKKTFSLEYVQELRAENAKHRTKNKELETGFNEMKSQLETMKKTVSSAFGLKNGDTPTPEALQAQLEKYQNDIKSRDATIKELRVTSKLSNQYTKHQVDPEITEAILARRGILAELDPEDADFEKKLSGAIKKLAEEQPRIKITANGQEPANRNTSGGGDTRGKGDDGAKGQLTPEDAKKMKPEEVAQAVKDGKFDAALGRTKKE